MAPWEGCTGALVSGPNCTDGCRVPELWRACGGHAPPLWPAGTSCLTPRTVPGFLPLCPRHGGHPLRQPGCFLLLHRAGAATPASCFTSSRSVIHEHHCSSLSPRRSCRCAPLLGAAAREVRGGAGMEGERRAAGLVWARQGGGHDHVGPALPAAPSQRSRLQTLCSPHGPLRLPRSGVSSYTFRINEKVACCDVCSRGEHLAAWCMDSLCRVADGQLACVRCGGAKGSPSRGSLIVKNTLRF